MSIRIRLFYRELQSLAGGHDSVTVEGQTVGECLEDLVRRYPGVEKLILDDRGRLLKYVYVYVNAEGLNKAELSRAVTERDELILAVLITGG
ncbi:MAG: MoaD/ThiS family protein [Dehalococcoidales bacterium]|nr:MoaD/ThiS family protein [Dehalococcoidales bacterium]